METVHPANLPEEPAWDAHVAPATVIALQRNREGQAASGRKGRVNSLRGRREATPEATRRLLGGGLLGR
jgi:hypothetical protein